MVINGECWPCLRYRASISLLLFSHPSFSPACATLHSTSFLVSGRKTLPHLHHQTTEPSSSPPSSSSSPRSFFSLRLQQRTRINFPLFCYHRPVRLHHLPSSSSSSLLHPLHAVCLAIPTVFVATSRAIVTSSDVQATVQHRGRWPAPPVTSVLLSTITSLAESSISSRVGLLPCCIVKPLPCRPSNLSSSILCFQFWFAEPYM